MEKGFPFAIIMELAQTKHTERFILSWERKIKIMDGAIFAENILSKRKKDLRENCLLVH